MKQQEQAQMRQLSTDWFHSLAHLLSPIFATRHMTVGVLPETFQPCLAAPTVTVCPQAARTPGSEQSG